MQEDWREQLEKKIVYSVPGMDKVELYGNVVFSTAQRRLLRADIYSPPDRPKHERLPAVIFVSGDAGPEQTQELKNSGQYVSWAQLAAASGMIGVTFDHHSTENFTRLQDVSSEVVELFSFLRTNAETFGIHPDHLCLWSCSAAPPYALTWVLRERPSFIRCMIAYYGLLDLQHLIEDSDPPEMVRVMKTYSPVNYLCQRPIEIPPILVVRAGRDRPIYKEAVDRFVAEAKRCRVEHEFVDYPDGQHGFDIFDDTQESREIIRGTLDFIRRYA